MNRQIISIIFLILFLVGCKQNNQIQVIEEMSVMDKEELALNNFIIAKEGDIKSWKRSEEPGMYIVDWQNGLYLFKDGDEIVCQGFHSTFEKKLEKIIIQWGKEETMTKPRESPGCGNECPSASFEIDNEGRSPKIINDVEPKTEKEIIETQEKSFYYGDVVTINNDFHNGTRGIIKNKNKYKNTYDVKLIEFSETILNVKVYDLNKFVNKHCKIVVN